jgi:hypothetical protein
VSCRGGTASRGGRRGLTSGAGRQMEKRAASVLIRVGALLGRGLLWRLSRFGPLGPFLIFFISFPFLFSDLCFISYLLQKCFNSIQTNS